MIVSDDLVPAGDLSDDSSRIGPVQAHIDAALVPQTMLYPPPLDALLTLGEPNTGDVEACRAALPIGQEHVADLVRMARDQALNTASGDSAAVWAPVHALDLLATLDNTAVVPDLIPLLDVDDDWFGGALTEIFVEAGRAALAPLQAYMSDQTRWTYGRSVAIDAVAALAKQHPAMRDAAVQALVGVLRDPTDTNPEINGFVIGSLLALKATEALPDMRHALAAHWVDETIAGGWGDVQEALGLTPDPTDPLVAESAQRRQERHAQMFPPGLRERLAALSAAPPTAPASGTRAPKANNRNRKAKNKRKQAAASRKANRKRK